MTVIFVWEICIQTKQVERKERHAQTNICLWPWVLTRITEVQKWCTSQTSFLKFCICKERQENQTSLPLCPIVLLWLTLREGSHTPVMAGSAHSPQSQKELWPAISMLNPTLTQGQFSFHFHNGWICCVSLSDLAFCPAAWPITDL